MYIENFWLGPGSPLRISQPWFTKKGKKINLRKIAIKLHENYGNKDFIFLCLNLTRWGAGRYKINEFTQRKKFRELTKTNGIS